MRSVCRAREQCKGAYKASARTAVHVAVPMTQQAIHPSDNTKGVCRKNKRLTVQNHVFDTVNNSDVASTVDSCQVASTKPAILCESLLACLGQLPVALEDSGPSALDFPYLMGARLQSNAFWAHQAHIQKAEGTSRCADKVKLLLGTAAKRQYEAKSTKRAQQKPLTSVNRSIKSLLYQHNQSIRAIQKFMWS
jgi:hypothetical protein